MRCAPLVLVFALAGAGLAGEAQADDSSLVATGSLSSGYTNNILGVPETDDPLAPQVQPDAFMSVAPGLAAAYETLRAVHNLSYVFGARLFMTHSEANSFTNSLRYDGLNYLSAVSSLRFGAGFTSGRINAFDRSNSEIVDDTSELPRGDLAYVAGRVGANYTRLLSAVTSTSTSASLYSFQPTNTASSSANYSIQLRSNIERSFQYHLVGTAIRGSYIINPRQNDDMTPANQAVNIGPEAYWNWDISESFVSQAVVGLAAVVRAPDFLKGVVLPRGSASLSFVRPRGRATVSYIHGVGSNVFTGRIIVNDRYSGRVDLPVPFTDRWRLRGGLGYRSGRYLNIEAQTLTGVSQQFTGNVGLGIVLSQAWGLGARYEFNRQFTENPTTGQTRGIARRVFTVVLGGRFPAQVARQVSDTSGTSATAGAHQNFE
jgi:hypothetical protein